MKGFERFTKKIIKDTSEIFARKIDFKEHKEHGGAFVWENLVNDKEFIPKIPGRDQLSEREKFLMDVFHEFSEVHTSFSCLKNIEIYIRRFPYGPLGISKVEYLRYNIENYFHEIYILQERLKTFATRIERKLRKLSKSPLDGEIFSDIKKRVVTGFENLNNVRGKHVHSRRFADTKIDNLVLLELLTEGSPLPFKVLYEQKYKQIRKEWIGTIKKLNNDIELALDDYFDTVYKVLFIKSGKLKLK